MTVAHGIGRTNVMDQVGIPLGGAEVHEQPARGVGPIGPEVASRMDCILSRCRGLVGQLINNP